MTTMMAHLKGHSDRSFADPSILLASDSERLGRLLHQTLHERGFAIEYAGDYTRLEEALIGRGFDVVLLEVTGEDAVESAVEAALSVKRANTNQFVGYLADPDLHTSGLAGDAVFPRSHAALPEMLRSFFSEEARRLE